MKRLTDLEQEWLWAELAFALEQGRSLAAAVAELAQSQAPSRVEGPLRALGAALAAGQSLSQALELHNAAFGADAAAVIRSGEASGRLPETLRDLAAMRRLDGTVSRGVLGAVVYPLIICVASCVITAALFWVLWPHFRGMMVELNMDMSPAVFVLMFWTQIEALLLLVMPAVLLIVIYVTPVSFPPLRRVVDALRLWTPGLGGALSRILLARWCRAMGCLLRAGVPEPEAVRLAGMGTGNRSVARISRRAADEVSTGRRLSEALAPHRFFPGSLTWMVGAAEERGGHADVWDLAQATYQREGEARVKMADVLLRFAFGVLALQIVGAGVVLITRPMFVMMRYLGG